MAVEKGIEEGTEMGIIVVREDIATIRGDSLSRYFEVDSYY